LEIKEAMTSKVLEYHRRTKHYPWRYAKSLGYLYWDTQPNPFRFWEGVEIVNPSSGNLYPTECYLVFPNIAGLKGVTTTTPTSTRWRKLGI